MTELTERLNRFEGRLHSLESELVELRRLAASVTPEPGASKTPEPEKPLWELMASADEPQAPPTPPPLVDTTPVAAASRRKVELSEVVGARALAWAGGSVTLLGIVFFFVLAVERGWIGPWTRVGLGALASFACVAAGAILHRRFGDTYASVSAAGAGVAGLYATLLAATALYDLAPRPSALLAAAAIACLGAALAIVWRSQTLAALGLLGALLVPVPIALQDGHQSPIGTAFAAVVLGAAICVAVPRSWRALQTTATVVAMLESLGLALAHEPHATVIAAVVWFVATAGAVWLTMRERVGYLPTTLTTFTALFAGWTTAILYDGDARGLVLLAIGLLYGVVSSVLWHRDRDVAAVLWAIALAVTAVGAATLLSGSTLTIVWAVEAATLAWLARRIPEPRFQLAAGGWLLLAYAHALGVDATPAKLFVANDDTWAAALSACALAAGTAVAGLTTSDWHARGERAIDRLVAQLRAAQPRVRVAAFALAGATALYAGSLVVVTLPNAWDWGHVAVVGLWAAVSVALALSAHRHVAACIAAGACALVVSYDFLFVASPQRWWSFGIAGGLTIAVAVIRERDAAQNGDQASLAFLLGGVGFSTAAACGLLDGRPLGAALLTLGGVLGAIGVAFLRPRRDFASVSCGAGLALAVPGSLLLVHGTWLVLVWAAATSALAVLTRYEPRLTYAAAPYLALAFGHTLALEAQPGDLFIANRHPGAGASAVLLCAIAAAVLAHERRPLRIPATWLAGTLGLYAATLAMLELFEDSGHAVDTAFQRGHTAASALWAVVGLTLLVAGLKRGGRQLRIGGFVLFGASLVKLFVYDLAFLSSVARAGSFLAVGAMLLAGGFFYQRLAANAAAPALDSPA
jgi:uncharacterized membrane protein